MTHPQNPNVNSPLHTQAVLRKIRMRKEDSAFVYCILEASGGITSYTTIGVQASDAHRDVELQIPFHFQDEVDAMLKRLGDLVYELIEDPS